MMNRRIYGFVGEIEEPNRMLNTEAKYRFSAVVQLVYFRSPKDIDSPYSDSWFWVKVPAFSSNGTLTDPQSVMLGDIVTGIRVPTFWTHPTDTLDTLRKTDHTEWQMGGIGGAPKPRYMEIDPGAIDDLPVLGGSAFDLERIRCSIPAVRLRTPNLDPHLFHREMKAGPDGQKSQGESVTIDPRESDGYSYRVESKKLYSSIYRKQGRDESVLNRARRGHSKKPGERREEKETNEEKRDGEPRRGRSPGRSLTFTRVGVRELAKGPK